MKQSVIARFTILIIIAMQFRSPVTVLTFDLHQVMVLGLVLLFPLMYRNRSIGISPDMRMITTLWYGVLFWLVLSTALNVWLFGAQYDELKWVFGDLKNVGLSFLFFGAVAFGMNDRADTTRWKFLLWVAGIIAGVSLFEWTLNHIHIDNLYTTLFNPPIFERGGDYRGQAGFDGPNTYAAVLNIAQGLLGAYALSTTGRRRLLALSAAVLMVLPVLWTGSRGGLLGVLVVGASLVVWVPAVRWQKVWVAITISLILTAVSATMLWLSPEVYGLQRLEKTGLLYSTDGDRRILLWRSALEIYVDNPVLGIGLGRYVTLIESYANTYQSPPHSDFLKLAAEAGTPGLFLGSILLSWPLWLAWRRTKAGSISGAMIGVGLTVFVFHEAFFNYLFSARMALIFSILLGCLVSTERTEVNTCPASLP